jgi:hypothetical protein
MTTSNHEPKNPGTGINRLEAATKSVPAMKYEYALIGLAATVAEIVGIYRSAQVQSPQAVVLATVLALVGMVLIWVFVNISRQRLPNDDLAAKAIIWTCVFTFIASVGLSTSLSIKREPGYLADILGFPELSLQPDDELKEEVAVIIATGTAKPPIDPQVHYNTRVAQIL